MKFVLAALTLVLVVACAPDKEDPVPSSGGGNGGGSGAEGSAPSDEGKSPQFPEYRSLKGTDVNQGRGTFVVRVKDFAKFQELLQPPMKVVAAGEFFSGKESSQQTNPLKGRTYCGLTQSTFGELHKEDLVDIELTAADTNEERVSRLDPSGQWRDERSLTLEMSEPDFAIFCFKDHDIDKSFSLYDLQVAFHNILEFKIVANLEPIAKKQPVDADGYCSQELLTDLKQLAETYRRNQEASLQRRVEYMESPEATSLENVTQQTDSLKSEFHQTCERFLSAYGTFRCPVKDSDGMLSSQRVESFCFSSGEPNQ